MEERSSDNVDLQRWEEDCRWIVECNNNIFFFNVDSFFKRFFIAVNCNFFVSTCSRFFIIRSFLWHSFCLLFLLLLLLLFFFVHTLFSGAVRGGDIVRYVDGERVYQAGQTQSMYDAFNNKKGKVYNLLGERVRLRIAVCLRRYDKIMLTLQQLFY